MVMCARGCGAVRLCAVPRDARSEVPDVRPSAFLLSHPTQKYFFLARLKIYEGRHAPRAISPFKKGMGRGGWNGKSTPIPPNTTLAPWYTIHNTGALSLLTSPDIQ